MPTKEMTVRGYLLILVAWIAVGLLTYIVWKSAQLDDFAKSIVTLLLGRFLGYIDNAYSYEFQTSRGSKDKDATIAELTSKIPRDTTT